jgi:hypothetical protein
VAKPPPRRLYCIDEDLGNFQFGIDLIFHGLGWLALAWRARDRMSAEHRCGRKHITRTAFS